MASSATPPTWRRLLNPLLASLLGVLASLAGSVTFLTSPVATLSAALSPPVHIQEESSGVAVPGEGEGYCHLALDSPLQRNARVFADRAQCKSARFCASSAAGPFNCSDLAPSATSGTIDAAVTMEAGRGYVVLLDKCPAACPQDLILSIAGTGGFASWRAQRRRVGIGLVLLMAIVAVVAAFLLSSDTFCDLLRWTIVKRRLAAVDSGELARWRNRRRVLRRLHRDEVARELLEFKWQIRDPVLAEGEARALAESLIEHVSAIYSPLLARQTDASIADAEKRLPKQWREKQRSLAEWCLVRDLAVQVGGR